MRFLTFDLFESITQAKNILQDLGVDSSDTGYQQIMELIRKKPGYAASFVAWHYYDNVPIEDLRNLYNLIERVKLDRPIQEFRTFQDLQEYLINKKIDRDVNQIIKYLPAFQQTLVNDDVKELIRDYLGYRDQIIKFLKDKSSALKTTEDLYFGLWDTVRKFKYAMNRPKILEEIQESGARLVHQDDETIIAQTTTHQQMCRLGPTNWCIVRNQSDWNDWTQNNKSQFIIWDFTKSKSDNDSILGITIDQHGRPAGAYQRNDTSYDANKILAKWGRYLKP